MGVRRAIRGGALGALLLAASLTPAATPPPGAKHLGTASCATGVCHGRSAPVADRDVALNEYAIWLQKDRHSQAYRALESADGRRIVANLGLPSAKTAKICLDCHTDNVSAALQGAKFKITDGVGCEACHGAAEKWIEAHSHKEATHATNVAKGLYPSETPIGRAELCLGCHAGTADRFATHELMGAGHPRLSFELEAFTTDQPPHFRRDDPSYRRRKGRIDGVNLWVTGQLRSVSRQMTLLQAWWGRAGGALPEFALYDCHSCHHPMSNARWSRERVGAGIAPGTLRLQTGNLVVLRAITETLDGPKESDALGQATQALVLAGQRDAAALRIATERISAWVKAHDEWSRRSYSAEDTVRLRKALVRYAAANRASDFLAAEQIVLGLDSLSYSLNDHDARRRVLDALFDTVKNATGFDPTRFASVAKTAAAEL